MPLIKFIGYTGILLIAESIATALVGLLVMPACALAGKARYDSKVKALHWSTFGVKCIALWADATIIVIGAAHYSAGSAWYFWPSIVTGGILLVFFKNDSMLTAERDARRAAEREFASRDFPLAALDPIRRLWKQESMAIAAAFLYVLLGAMFTPLTKIQWLQAAAGGLLRLLAVHWLLSGALYIIGWLVAGRYLFVICTSLPLLLFSSSRPRKSGNACERRE